MIFLAVVGKLGYHADLILTTCDVGRQKQEVVEGLNFRYQKIFFLILEINSPIEEHNSLFMGNRQKFL